MIDTKLFGRKIKELGYGLFSGVPCSFLKSLINFAINECRFVMAANEGDAVAVCTGAHIGGTKSVFLCQNSGLTNAVSPLTSLNFCFKIPVLGFVSLRGEPGISDEPQHELMGQITCDMLDIMRIKWEILSDDIDEAIKQLQTADKYIENNESFFFVVKKNTFGSEKLIGNVSPRNSNIKIIDTKSTDELPTRYDALLKITESSKDDDTVFLATTGFTGRELYEIEDSENNLYMVGSMGCIGSLGLGLSLVREDKNIVVLDGDGSLLMRMGSLAVNAGYAGGNFLHILFDNNSYESTGGQSTISANVDFSQIAASSGYSIVKNIHNLTELGDAVTQWKEDKKITFLNIKIKLGVKENLGRPKVTPEQVKNRLISFLNK